MYNRDYYLFEAEPIEQFKIRFPNIELPTYTSTEKSGEFCEVMNTNVKLF